MHCGLGYHGTFRNFQGKTWAPDLLPFSCAREAKEAKKEASRGSRKTASLSVCLPALSAQNLHMLHEKPASLELPPVHDRTPL
jgi:hypothetical protein